MLGGLELIEGLLNDIKDVYTEYSKTPNDIVASLDRKKSKNPSSTNYDWISKVIWEESSEDGIHEGQEETQKDEEDVHEEQEE